DASGNAVRAHGDRARPADGQVRVVGRDAADAVRAGRLLARPLTRLRAARRRRAATAAAAMAVAVARAPRARGADRIVREAANAVHTGCVLARAGHRLRALRGGRAATATAAMAVAVARAARARGADRIVREAAHS